MSEPLTPMERRVYHYLIDFLAENTFQPSIREIARQFRIKSTKTVSDVLGSLHEKGYIRRDESRSRGVRLIGFAGAGATQPVPFFDRLHAGDGAPRVEHRSSSITLDRRFLPSEDVFFLRARGDAMSGRGIVDGDFVMVSPSAHAKDGDLVAARLGADVLVRVLAHRGAAVVLEGGNDRAREVGSRDDFAVLGVVCGIFRPFYEAVPVTQPES